MPQVSRWMASTAELVAGGHWDFGGSEIMRIMTACLDGKVSVSSLSGLVREPTPGYYRSTRGTLFSSTAIVPAISYILEMLAILSIHRALWPRNYNILVSTGFGLPV
jgi:hypothetical protein